MKIRILSSVAILAAMTLGALTSCDTDEEALEIQGLTTYDEQYFANLRAFKASDHEISYAYYADWAPIEGASGYKDPASWGERIKGLPDSLDIVNLWMGIPTPESHPIAYEDMVYAQQKLGTRFVFHADASNYNHQFWYRDENFNVDQSRVIDLSSDRSEEALRAYARWAVDTVVKCGIDGVDFDYEGWSGDPMYIVADECNKYFGPDGQWPEKLFIIDYFGSNPPASCEPYCDYLVSQAYSQQVGFRVGAPSGWPDEKMIYCESFGQKPEGGVIWDYAAWEPATGHKGGCGAYYLERNYYHASNGVPYQAMREAIQIMNPALKK
ncbi:MAG: glycoside hydrolase family 18 [Bacteroidales bacterium]|nr:glycoside hydrolase family 18 [Bacteroidales bacterium]